MSKTLSDYLFYHEPGPPEISIYLGDCLEVMPLLPKVDLVITDPPYGIDFTQRTTGKKILGDDVAFDPTILFKAGSKYFIWGANHFHHLLPHGGQFHVWLKRAVEVAATKSYSDCEFAWCSESKSSKVFRLISDGCIREGEEFGIKRVHPSQKPRELMRWSIRLTGEGLILDPFMGSGSTLVAAKELRQPAIGIELDESYCESAKTRLKNTIVPFL